MYSIPKSENNNAQTQQNADNPSVPKTLHIVLTIAGILLLLAAGLLILEYTNNKKNGTVAGVSTSAKNQKLFEELRSMPEYSKFYTELIRTRAYKKMLEGKYTIVAINNQNLGNSVFNIEDYILYNEFGDDTQTLLSLSNRQVEYTEDSLGIQKLNGIDIINQYTFPSGSIIEIERKY